eukprot:1939341-Prymnesium_polylepis.1
MTRTSTSSAPSKARKVFHSLVAVLPHFLSQGIERCAAFVLVALPHDGGGLVLRKRSVQLAPTIPGEKICEQEIECKAFAHEQYRAEGVSFVNKGSPLIPTGPLEMA